MPASDLHDPHAWFRARLDASVLGLLSEAEERRFDEHAASCSRCAAILTAFRANLPEPDTDYRHLPPTLVARWDRRVPDLRGVERRLVREHLDSCDVCRRALTTLGFDPKLIEPARPVLELVPGRRLRDWLTGGAIGALATAAAATLIVPTLVHRVPTPMVAPAPAPITAPATDRYSLGVVLEAPAEVPAFRDVTRGTATAAPAVVTLRIPPGTRFVQFPTPALYSGSGVDLEVVGPDGRTLARDHRERTELRKSSRILFGRPDQALEPGRYLLRLTIAPEAGSSAPPETLATGFIVTIASR